MGTTDVMKKKNIALEDSIPRYSAYNKYITVTATIFSSFIAAATTT
jgi:hypothetical protein